VPVASNGAEETLLFADDIVYTLRFPYKIGKSINQKANEKAIEIAQIYLSKLEQWMNKWRLTLAPHKCAQIIFSKARDLRNDSLALTLYGEPIPRESNPKFLGIVFDSRLKFDVHVEKLKIKVNERLNLLKILSYDKNWNLDTNLLIKFYKVLIRSLIDYACVASAVLTKEVSDELEKMQNNALRIIFKKKLTDQVKNEDLRSWANVVTIKERHRQLMTRYFEKCLTSNNPLIIKLFTNYKEFKHRLCLGENLALNLDGEVNEVLLRAIQKHNAKCILGDEKYKTTLCMEEPIIKEFMLDSYGLGHLLDQGIT
jgi:hypothetical protein